MKADSLRAALAPSATVAAPPGRSPAPFTLLRVHGPDAAEFLHRLATQDVLGLPAGGVRPLAFLDAKGKLLVTALVLRRADGLWLEVAAEQAERLATLLERYHFTEKLAIERPATWCREAITAAAGADGGHVVEHGDAGFTVDCSRRGVRFVRRHHFGSAPVAETELAADRAECLRLLAGFLRVGVESEPTTLALEADLDDHISTTKGCYTGQEIVARIHTYGHTNRKACLVLLPAGAALTAPQPLHDEDGLAVGRVLHAVPVPGHAARLGVAYLPKDFQAAGTKLTLGDAGVVEVLDASPARSS